MWIKKNLTTIFTDRKIKNLFNSQFVKLMFIKTKDFVNKGFLNLFAVEKAVRNTNNLKTKFFSRTYPPIHIANNNKKVFKNLFVINNYRYLLIIFLFFFKFETMQAQLPFLEYQKNFERVKTAFNTHQTRLQSELVKANFGFPLKDLLFIAYKEESILELWIKDGSKYRLFKSYKICVKSGELGPKYKQGDKQVPEGFYFITIFNPESSFHLSLGLDYPNLADRARSSHKNLGGDIYIHGDCISIGCLPMTDKIIEEIYVLSAWAKSNGQEKIPVHIYPFRFNKNLEQKYFAAYPQHILFWKSLKKHYKYFQKRNKIGKFSIDFNGNYLFRK